MIIWLRSSVDSLLQRLSSTYAFYNTSQHLVPSTGSTIAPLQNHLLRHPITHIPGSGIKTRFPSTTLFSLALGADLPREDYLYPGNLVFSANGFFIHFFVTHAGIFTCNTSSRHRHLPSTAYTTLSYHLIIPRYYQIRSFGYMLSPVTLSAQDNSTSELLRTL